MLEHSEGNASLLDRFLSPQGLIDGLMDEIEATEEERQVLHEMVSWYVEEISEHPSADEIVKKYQTIGYNSLRTLEAIIALEIPTALFVLREKQSGSFAVLPGEAPDDWDDPHEIYESHIDQAECQLKEVFVQNNLGYLRRLLTQQREEDASFKDSPYWKE